MATKTGTPFGKPAKAGDGNFEFQLPEEMGQGRGRIKAGPYVGRIVSIIPDTAQSSGNPMWVWTAVITKGPHAGRDFKMYTALTDSAAWKVAETLKALGIEAEAGQKVSISKKDVIGVGCTLHIKDDAGKDGDGEFSKLDKISAHPNGAGYRPGTVGSGKAKPEPEPEEEEVGEEETEESEDDTGYPREFDEGEVEEEESEEEEEEEPAPKRKPAPAKKSGGKAAPSLGKKKR